MIRHWSTITLVAATGILSVYPDTAAAQQRLGLRERPAARSTLASGTTVFSQPIAPDDRTSAKLLGGIVGGGLGMFFGALAGAKIEQDTRDRCYEDCGVAGLLIGAAIGEGIGFGLGVHLAEPKSDRTAARLIAPIAISLGGMLIALKANKAALLLPIVPLQFVVTF